MNTILKTNPRVLLFLLLALVMSCSDSDDKKSSRTDEGFLTIGNKAVSLPSYKIYFLFETEAVPGLYVKHFAITDGTYESGSGDNFENYDNASYFFKVDLFNVETLFSEDNYECFEGDYTNTDGPLSLFSFAKYDANSASLDFQWDFSSLATPVQFVSCSGGFEVGQELIIDFEGTAWYRDDAGQGPVDIKFRLSGVILDL